MNRDADTRLLITAGILYVLTFLGLFLWGMAQ